ncbi:MAG: plasmid mobilization relaxosome protein MobC [Ruminococcus sp.]|nr:plasmid mobilization relaxosome protein MobC [Ruminococcus sp.]
MNFTEFVTNSALNKKIIKIDGLTDVLKEIKAIGRNLNQLTTLCNMGKIVYPDLTDLKADYAKAIEALDEIARRCG